LKENYKIFIKNLDDPIEVKNYKELLTTKWDNNVYYSIEHLLHFEKDADKN